MEKRKLRGLTASVTASAMLFSMMCVSGGLMFDSTGDNVVYAETISDMPSEYQSAADWIWTNRIVAENSLGSSNSRWNSMFDQIIDGKGTINYVVRWHSTKTITLEQRQKLEDALDNCINEWTDWLVGYENWPYEHVDVNIVGWAVTDKSLLLDLQDDEIVYTDTVEYVIQPGESNEIPTTMANAPSELSRFDHFADESYEYPGGLDKRFDQYLWATQGFPDYGGCGGDWGQRLSDNYYIGIAEGTSTYHVQIHELGHGFGITDFYGGEGESDGYPPGGFPGNGTSIMMAGSSSVITDFDGWLLRYMWTKIKDEEGRFDMENALPETPIEPATDPTDPTEPPTDPTEPVEPQPEENYMTFEDGTMIALKNAGSGYYLGVQDGKAENMANVCQYGNGRMEQNIWTLKSAGDGYYYLYSKLDGGEKYLLDLYYGLADDGTKIGIHENTYSDAQLFKFLDNGDGTCTVVTKATTDRSCVGVEGDYTAENAGIVQNTRNGSDDQKWIIRNPKFMGYKGDCSGMDDVLNGTDCKRMAEHILNKEPFVDNPMEFIDMNGDGAINIFDLTILKSMAADKNEWKALYDCED